MIRGRIAAGLAACITLVAVGTGVSSLARAEQTPIKQLMGDNFSGLQTILVSLITSNYAAVPAKANAIHEHAVDLAQMAPESPASDRQLFLSYAYNLDVHALDIKSIVELLIQHDQERKQDGRLSADHLRDALPAHYGGMVTMCVACHNRFRQTVIEQ